MNCVVCGTEFYARPSSVAKGKKYCSRDCYVEASQSAASERVETGTKTCSKCGVSKAIGLFYTHGFRNQVDRTSSWCKECRKSNEKDRRANAEHVSRFHAKYETDMDFRSRELLRAIGKKCRRLGLECDLDRAWLSSKLSAGLCELSGLPFNLSVATRRRNAFTPSIDRIVAGGGYTKANCRVVIYALNVAMSDWGLDVVVKIAEALCHATGKEAAA